MIQPVAERIVSGPHFEMRVIVAPVKMVGSYFSDGENVGDDMLIPFYFNPRLDQWLSVETYHLKFGTFGTAFTGTIPPYGVENSANPWHEIPASGYLVYATGSHGVTVGPSGATIKIVHADDSLSTSFDLESISIPDAITGKVSWAHVFANPHLLDPYDLISAEVIAAVPATDAPDDPALTLGFKMRLVPRD